MRVKSLTLLLLTASLPLFGQVQAGKKLSQNAKISLLTCGPGEAIYSKFGHSALWVYDPLTGIDRIYNYGTFDFYSNDFYIQFIKGTALYRLSITNFLTFYEEYRGENRSIIEQELNLSDAEKQELFQKLEINYLPENRYYRYDFLFQNCSSLIRDIVWDVTEERFIIPEDSEEYFTYRSMMFPYLKDSPWSGNGMLLLLGHRTDKHADAWDQMYLPDYMMNWFEVAKTSTGESLVSKTQTLFLPGPDKSKASFLSHPVFILSVLNILILFLSWRGIRKNKKTRLLDSLVFFIGGLVGVLMLFMWLSSLHLVTHQNLVMIWAFPLHILLVIIVWIRKSTNIVKAYARIMAPLSILFFLTFWIFPQVQTSLAIFLGLMVTIRLIFLAEYPFLKKLIR